MPIIEATLVTNTDMSIAWERKKMAAPVIATLTNPSARGSAAAASEPNTASRINRTMGKPVASADSRSSFERSCIPAHRACWPTRWVRTAPDCSSLRARRSRRSTAASAA